MAFGSVLARAMILANLAFYRQLCRWTQMQLGSSPHAAETILGSGILFVLVAVQCVLCIGWYLTSGEFDYAYRFRWWAEFQLKLLRL